MVYGVLSIFVLSSYRSDMAGKFQRRDHRGRCAGKLLLCVPDCDELQNQIRERDNRVRHELDIHLRNKVLRFDLDRAPLDKRRCI